MRTFNKKPLALGVAAGMAMLVASTGAMAISSGTDLNLSAKARAGGMAGAAYTMPQEASAAVFGNPATMTQFNGINMNFGASLLMLEEVSSTQTINGVSNKSVSDADNYIIPDFGLTIQLSPNLVIGTGLEVDAGIGVDYRDDPIALGGDVATITLPLVVELISFNANIGGAYQVTDKLSVGAAVTIGFGLMQVGTAGQTQGLATIGIDNFGGTTSSVHDIGFGASLGATYQLADGIMTSATIKSPVEYNFRNVNSYIDGVGNSVYTTLQVDQPLEVILGVAFDNVLMDGLLVEADVIWKNWDDADAYSSFLDDQILVTIGAQLEMGNWAFRAGYSWAEDNQKGTPEACLGAICQIGTLPVSSEVMRIAVQTALVPTYWQHTITAGTGYSFTENVSVDVFAAYAFSEDMERKTPGLDAATTLSSTYKGEVEAEIMVGAGINIALP